MWLKNYEIARDSAQAVLEFAERHGFHIWSAVGSCMLGSALVNIGERERGLALIERGLNAYRGLKTPPVFWPMLLHLCAGAYGVASRSKVGLSLLSEAMAAASPTSARRRLCAGAFDSEGRPSRGAVVK